MVRKEEEKKPRKKHFPEPSVLSTAPCQKLYSYFWRKSLNVLSMYRIFELNGENRQW